MKIDTIRLWLIDVEKKKKYSCATYVEIVLLLYVSKQIFMASAIIIIGVYFVFVFFLLNFHEAALRRAYRFHANRQWYDMQVICASRNCKHMTQVFSQCVLLYQCWKSLEHKALYIRISHIFFHEAYKCVRIWTAKLWFW